MQKLIIDKINEYLDNVKCVTLNPHVDNTPDYEIYKPKLPRKLKKHVESINYTFEV